MQTVVIIQTTKKADHSQLIESEVTKTTIRLNAKVIQINFPELFIDHQNFIITIGTEIIDVKLDHHENFLSYNTKIFHRIQIDSIKTIEATHQNVNEKKNQLQTQPEVTIDPQELNQTKLLIFK